MAKKRKYIYTNKKHPAGAIMSVILGTISAVSMIAVVYITYLAGGATKPGYGLTGLLAVVFSLIGFVLSITSLQKREIFRVYSVVGLILNLVNLIGIGGIVYMGTLF